MAKTYYFLFVAACLVLCFNPADKIFASASHNVTGYVWSDKIGWISMNSLGDMRHGWMQMEKPLNWQSVAVSKGIREDGKYQTASGYVISSQRSVNSAYTSFDYGHNWSKKIENVIFNDVAMSADGKYQIGAVGTTSCIRAVYISSDWGNSWVRNMSFSNKVAWDNVAISGDGKYQIVVGDNYYMHSNDYGVSWTRKYPRGTTTTQLFDGAAISYDGKYQSTTWLKSVGTTITDYGVLISFDYGQNWTNISSVGPGEVAMSASDNNQFDGKYLTVVKNRNIWISSDWGHTWTLKQPVDSAHHNRFFSSVSVSNTGQYQTAVQDLSGQGDIYISSDWGQTWNLRMFVSNYGGHYFADVSSSGSGKYQTAASKVNFTWLYNNSNYGDNGVLPDYGVNIAGDGTMSGYAWSDFFGQISFDAADLSGCPSGECRARVDMACSGGNCAVSGWARSLLAKNDPGHSGNWNGWIDLSGWYINKATGDFHGNATTVINGANYALNANCADSGSCDANVGCDIDGDRDSDGAAGCPAYGAIMEKNYRARTSAFAVSPIAAIACDAAACGNQAVCDCNSAGVCGGEDWIMFQPVGACDFNLKNMSLGDVSRSTWIFNLSLEACPLVSPKCSTKFPSSLMASGDYNVGLQAENAAGLNSVFHKLRILDDVRGGFMCSLEGTDLSANWKKCQDILLTAPTTVYFRDDENIAGVEENYSKGSGPAGETTIVSRDWQKNGVSVQPAAEQGDPEDQYESISVILGDTVTIAVKDSRGRTTTKEHTFTALPQAKMECDMVCSGGVCDNSSAASWVMYRPAENNSCVFTLNNKSESAATITQSTWSLTGENGNNYGTILSGTSDYGAIQSNVVKDNYDVKLTVVNSAGSSTANHSLAVLNDAHAGFSCSHNQKNWRSCDSIKKRTVGEKIYFKDDSLNENYSIPSDSFGGAASSTIVGRIWTFNDELISDPAVNPNAPEAFAKIVKGKNVVKLQIMDSNGRIDVQEYEINGFSFPRWEEFNLQGFLQNNFFANLIKIFMALF